MERKFAQLTKRSFYKKGNFKFAEFGKVFQQTQKKSLAKQASSSYIQLLKFVTNRFLRIETVPIVEGQRVEQLFLRDDFLLESSSNGGILAPVEKIVPARDQICNERDIEIEGERSQSNQRIA